MNTSNILKSIMEGPLRIGSWDNIKCYVLENKQRVISQRSFMQIIGMRGRGSNGHRIAHYLDNSVLKSNKIRDVLMDIQNPVQFYTSQNVTGYGYEGELLVEYCKALLDARRMGGLKSEVALRYADNAEKFMVSLAHVGIIALIDEATGYQETRDREALQQLLDKYLQKEFSAWAKRFPDEFYKQIFRLQGWEWSGMSVNRPSYVGKITNDIVYSRIEVGVLEELQKRNPWNHEKNRREGYHHCLLTEDYGVPALAQHLYAVVGLMRGSKDWHSFKTILQRAFPKKHESEQLLLELSS